MVDYGSCHQLNFDDLYEDNKAAPLHIGILKDEIWWQLRPTAETLQIT